MTREIKFRAWDKENKKMCDVIDFTCMNYPEEYEVMQYTGLLDKNGKEIYEGDIVRGGKCDGQVEWDEDGYIVNPFPSNAFATQLRNENKFIEIIGNIYENPELLVQLDK